MRSLRAVHVVNDCFPVKDPHIPPGSSFVAALARWCVRHRLVAVVLWLLAFGGVSAAAAVTGSAYSNDYEAPGTESGAATKLLQQGFPGLGGDSDTVVWHVRSGTVRAA